MGELAEALNGLQFGPDSMSRGETVKSLAPQVADPSLQFGPDSMSRGELPGDKRSRHLLVASIRPRLDESGRLRPHGPAAVVVPASIRPRLDESGRRR